MAMRSTGARTEGVDLVSKLFAREHALIQVPDQRVNLAVMAVMAVMKMKMVVVKMVVVVVVILVVILVVVVVIVVVVKTLVINVCDNGGNGDANWKRSHL